MAIGSYAFWCAFIVPYCMWRPSGLSYIGCLVSTMCKRGGLNTDTAELEKCANLLRICKRGGLNADTAELEKCANLPRICKRGGLNTDTAELQQMQVREAV